MKNPIITKLLCVLLMLALLTPIGSLIYEIFFHTDSDDGSLSTFLFFLCFCFINYIITFRYCNRLVSPLRSELRRSKLLFFLVMSTITFLCSVFTLMLIGYGFYELAQEGKSSPSLNGIVDLMIFVGLTIFALMGPIVFLMQLQIRKSLILNESTLNQLIDSIGSESQNNV